MSRMVPAGTELAYTVTWLEMRARPEGPPPHPPPGPAVSLQAAEDAPAWYFFALYDAVGRDYAWEDMHALPDARVAAWLASPGVALHSLMRGGWPAGFFVLDGTEPGVVDLAYLGLVPQAVGAGLGSFLLATALHTAWERPKTRKLTVNTCTLDHPAALGLYRRSGFVPVRREERRRTLTRPIPEPACSPT